MKRQLRLWEEPPTLSEMFPDLDGHMGFPLTHDADAWLKTLNGKNVQEQLVERRIRKVKATITFGLHGYMNALKDGGFSVTLAIARMTDGETYDQPVEEMAITLGHELGHTFQFDLASMPPTDRSPPMERGGELWNKMENYCEAFAAKWLEIGGNRRETIERLEALWDITAGIRRRSEDLFHVNR